MLREADCHTVAEVAKKHEVSEQAIYGWRQQLEDFEVENNKRK